MMSGINRMLSRFYPICAAGFKENSSAVLKYLNQASNRESGHRSSTDFGGVGSSRLRAGGANHWPAKPISIR
jgi:hypothetical protein